MTDYLRVPNWEKHQHRDLADKGDMPWFKFDSGIFDDPAICELNAYEFRAYIKALTLAARTGNKLPASGNWLRAHFGRSWFPVCSRLVSTSLLVGTLPPKKPPQNKTTGRATDAPIPSLEEKRGERTTTRDRSLEALDDARARENEAQASESGDEEERASTGRVEVPGWEAGSALEALGERGQVVELAGRRVRRAVLEEVSSTFAETVAAENDAGVAGEGRS